MEKSKKKKVFLSEPINKELKWIDEIEDRYIRDRLRNLENQISLTYTYFIYHDYTVKELAKIFEVTEQQVIIWILIGAYTLDGGDFNFGMGINLGESVKDILMRRYPEDKETIPCHRCVWADTRTGQVICFRNCRRFNCFQSK